MCSQCQHVAGVAPQLRQAARRHLGLRGHCNNFYISNTPLQHAHLTGSGVLLPRITPHRSDWEFGNSLIASQGAKGGPSR